MCSISWYKLNKLSFIKWQPGKYFVVFKKVWNVFCSGGGTALQCNI
jgi:hypothetical protein